MSNFFIQHVGEKLAERDFPRSLGTREKGLRWFGVRELFSWPEFRDHVPERDARLLQSDSTHEYQVWGLPTGAAKAISKMSPGDTLMLLTSPHECEFIGWIRYRLPSEAYDLSKRIWGEQRFSHIVLMTGCAFIDLRWQVFCKRIGYSENYFLQGTTTRVRQSKIEKAGFTEGSDLALWCRGHSV